MSPMSLMTDEEKREAVRLGVKGGKKDWGEDGAAEGVDTGAARRSSGYGKKADRRRACPGQGG